MEGSARPARRFKYDYGGLRVIALSNEKGGVAKTTSCINLAACLAQRGLEVLVLDMDPQANASLGLGVDPSRLSEQPDRLLTDERQSLARAIVKTQVKGLDLIPADNALASASKALVAEVGRETRLRTKILQHVRSPFSKKYDYMMIDCPPTLDLITHNVLIAATDLIVPVQPRFYSVQGMALLAETIRSLYRQLDPEIKLLGILVTLFDKSTALDQAIYELLKERVESEFGPDFLFKSVITRSILIGETELSDLPIVLREPGSRAAEAYQAVAEEMLARLESRPAVAH